MKDQGLNRGLVQEFDTSKAPKGAFYGFRKMFWKFLNKLHVPFFDPCCDEAGADGNNYVPLRYNREDEVMEFYNPDTKVWETVA